MRVKFYSTVVILIFLIATGCAHYGALEEDYGKSYNSAKSGQILNPGASENLEPAIGLNGDAASATMDKYIESFSKASKKQATKGSVIPANTVGIGQYENGK